MDILKTTLVVLLCALVVDYQGIWVDVYRYVMWFMVVIAAIKSCTFLSLHYLNKIPDATRKALHNSIDVVTCICSMVLFVAHLITISEIGAMWLYLAYTVTFSMSWIMVLVVTYKEFKE